MTNLIISFIRTIVPSVIGALISFLASHGINVDAGTATALGVALTGVATAAYYLVVRLLETKLSSKFGWLLGAPKTPLY